MPMATAMEKSSGRVALVFLLVVIVGPDYEAKLMK
jgi:hypothetical protein